MFPRSPKAPPLTWRMAATNTEPVNGWRTFNGAISEIQRNLLPSRLTRACNGRVPLRLLLPLLIRQAIVLIVLAASTVTAFGFGFQLPAQRSALPKPFVCGIYRSSLVYNGNDIYDGRKNAPKMNMVRNIDLPEALVLYGLESMMTQEKDEKIHGAAFDADSSISCMLRPGVARLLNECREVGTAALLLSEELGEEESVKRAFLKAWGKSSDAGDVKMIKTLTEVDDPVINFRCLNSEFATPANNANDGSSDHDSLDEYDESIEFYNVQTKGRSPSPAFLLDSLRSVHIDPRGFGGSSGFGLGQWIEPRRSPMPARTVVFIGGDWGKSKDQSMGGEEKSTVYDRCAAARAAGCRVIYLEQPPDPTQQEIPVQDDTQTMALCDAVMSTLGNDNPRDLQPITLDAVSTPGDYWLNPPSPRDDIGNAVSVDDIVEWFRSEREMEEIIGEEGCVVSDDAVEGDEMSDEEMNKILADLDGL